MKKGMKKLIAALAIGCTFVGMSPAYAADESAMSSIVNATKMVGDVKSNNNVFWGENIVGVVAYGMGRASETDSNKKREQAKTTAEFVAQNDLRSILMSINIDGKNTVGSFLSQSDYSRNILDNIVANAPVIEESGSGDKYHVKRIVRLYGINSVASAVLPRSQSSKKSKFKEVKKTSLTPEEVENIKSAKYTGVIIDASNLNLSQALCPAIYDPKGKEVYSAKYVEATDNGTVMYGQSETDAKQYRRIGNNPLIIKPTGIFTDKQTKNNVDLVISREDADRMLIANQNGNFLANRAVIIINEKFTPYASPIMSNKEAETWATEGDLLRNVGNYDEALKSYYKGLIYSPDDSKIIVDIYMGIGDAYCNKQNYAAATKIYSQVTKYHKGTDGNWGLGRCALNLHDYDGTIQYFSSWLYAKPMNNGYASADKEKYLVAYLGRAIAYCEKDQSDSTDLYFIEKAADDIKVAEGIDPDNPAVKTTKDLITSRLEAHKAALVKQTGQQLKGLLKGVFK